MFLEVFDKANTALQGIGRCYRIGQKLAVNVYIISVIGTFDQAIMHKAQCKMMAQLAGMAHIDITSDKIKQLQNCNNIVTLLLEVANPRPHPNAWIQASEDKEEDLEEADVLSYEYSHFWHLTKQQ